MWTFSNEQAILLMNRMNDLWEVPTDEEHHLEFVATAQRLLGSLNMLFSPENFKKSKKQT